MASKTLYRVYNWDYDNSDRYFDTLKEARRYYNKMIKEEPYLRWRLYKDTEEEEGEGNFTEDCLATNE